MSHCDQTITAARGKNVWKKNRSALLVDPFLVTQYSTSLKKDATGIPLVALLALLETASKVSEFRPFFMTCCTQDAGVAEMMEQLWAQLPCQPDGQAATDGRS